MKIDTKIRKAGGLYEKPAESLWEGKMDSAFALMPGSAIVIEGQKNQTPGNRESWKLTMVSIEINKAKVTQILYVT